MRWGQRLSSREIAMRVVLAVIAGAVSFLLLYALRSALVGLAVALILAYLMDPLIDRFEARGWKRSPAIFACLVLGTITAVLAVLLLIPYVVNEVAGLSANLSGYAANIEGWVDYANEKMGTKVTLDLSSLRDTWPQLLRDVDTEQLDPLKRVAAWAASSTLAFVLGLANVLMIPVYTFYFLRDFDRMVAWVFNLVPVTWQPLVSKHARAIDTKMGQFIRGQLTLCTILAVLYSVGLIAFGRIDMALLVGVLSGALFIIPYLGTIVGVILGAVLCLLKFGIDWHLLGVVGTFGVVQLLEGTLLTPKIVGESVGLHPMVVILSLFIGGALFGFMGILLAVPATAALSVLLETVLARYRASRIYTEGR
jgi:predicted PurR-regulated permease PerM